MNQSCVVLGHRESFGGRDHARACFLVRVGPPAAKRDVSERLEPAVDVPIDSHPVRDLDERCDSRRSRPGCPRECLAQPGRFRPVQRIQLHVVDLLEQAQEVTPPTQDQREVRSMNQSSPPPRRVFRELRGPLQRLHCDQRGPVVLRARSRRLEIGGDRFAAAHGRRGPVPDATIRIAIERVRQRGVCSLPLPQRHGAGGSRGASTDDESAECRRRS
jgi:hypothetical protein